MPNVPAAVDRASTQSGVQIRRLRRTDFTAVMHLLAGAGGVVPAPDRRTLRRFRHITDDLGNDVYIYLVDGLLGGLIHLTYARQFTSGPRARIEALLVGDKFRRQGIGRTLLELGLQRAAKRSCSIVDCTAHPGNQAATRLLSSLGFTSDGVRYRRGSDAAQDE